ncbi:MAG: ArsR family transcriptional regulator [Micrococcaceae bacterium]
MYSATDQRTREKVFETLFHESPCSAAQIAKKLHLTTAAVRRHLDYYEEQGDIEVKMISPAGHAGRPARRYVLTAKAQDTAGNDYLEISKIALKKLQALSGDTAIEDLAHERAAEIKQAYEASSKPKDTLEERAEVLRKVLTDLDYAATTAERNIYGHHALQLCQTHCPILGLASDYPEFCTAEKDVFAEVLGVDVRQLGTMATGSHVCTTHIPLDRVE